MATLAVLEHSCRSSLYLALFLVTAFAIVVSKGTVSSTRWIEAWSLLLMTRSGRLSVQAMEAGLSLSLSHTHTHTHTHTHYSPCVLLEIFFQLFYFKITKAVKELKSNHRLILTGTPIQVSVYGHEQMQLQDLVIESLGISSFALHCRITLWTCGLCLIF